MSSRRRGSHGQNEHGCCQDRGKFSSLLEKLTHLPGWVWAVALMTAGVVYLVHSSFCSDRLWVHFFYDEEPAYKRKRCAREYMESQSFRGEHRHPAEQDGDA